MEVVQISKENFDNHFKQILDRLKLNKLESDPTGIDFQNNAEIAEFLRQAYRTFHYEVVSLKRKLEKS